MRRLRRPNTNGTNCCRIRWTRWSSVEDRLKQPEFYGVFKFFLSLDEGFLNEEGEEERKKYEIVLGPRSSKVVIVEVDGGTKFKIIKFRGLSLLREEANARLGKAWLAGSTRKRRRMEGGTEPRAKQTNTYDIRSLVETYHLMVL